MAPIANLTKSGELNMSLKIPRKATVMCRRPRDSAEGSERPNRQLQLDASFSPVSKVTYSVDRARVEQRTDLDKLVIDIEHD